MKFFDRKEEIAKLKAIYNRAKENAQFTIVTGRRRIGKTSLIMKAYEDTSYLYFFVGRKSEADLCEDFQLELEEKLGVVTFGRATKFSEIFKQVMLLAQKQHITLFIDEFQDFLRVNKSIFSDIQKIWDQYKSEAKINLIVCGSINRLMNKIFKDKEEPLYGRQTDEIRVLPFTPSVLKEIMYTYSPNYCSEDLLAMYALTGGVAKYVEHFVDKNALTLKSMLEMVCSKDSMYINEGKITLIEEFGKEYNTYFSILTAIASGHNQRNEIEDIVGKEVGGYLTKLEDDYNLIRKNQPMFEKTSSSNVKYVLYDNFFIFWFRFIYKYSYMIEIMAYDKLLRIIERDYPAFSGKALERYFKELLAESGRYTRIGSWWDKKGETDIDIIAENELEKTAEFIEVKRQPKRFEPSILEERMNDFLKATGHFNKYTLSCKCLSVDDM